MDVTEVFLSQSTWMILDVWLYANWSNLGAHFVIN